MFIATKNVAHKIVNIMVIVRPSSETALITGDSIRNQYRFNYKTIFLFLYLKLK